jgi:uncharacterized protein YndB with AHSA1/START domain
MARRTDYRFLTAWCLDAPIEAVWDAIHDSERYPSWWKGVQSVVRLEPGDDSGLGALSRYTAGAASCPTRSRSTCG